MLISALMKICLISRIRIICLDKKKNHLFRVLQSPRKISKKKNADSKDPNILPNEHKRRSAIQVASLFVVSVCKAKDLSCQRYHICEINNNEAIVIWNDKFDLHTKRVQVSRFVYCEGWRKTRPSCSCC